MADRYRGKPRRSYDKPKNRRRAKSPSQNPVQSIVGRNAVKEMLSSEPSRIEKIFVDRKNPSRDLVEISGMAKTQNVPVSFVPTVKLDKLGGRIPHQGVAAQISEIEYGILETILFEIASTPDEVKEKKPLLLFLDGIEDTGNLGAILRSAYGFGVSAVIVSGKSSAPVTAATVKASAGTANRIPITRAIDTSACLQQLKERGYWVIGMDRNTETTIWAHDWDKPSVIIIGSEGAGIGKEARELSDHLVEIPLRSDLESLNASVSAAVALSAATRNRV